METVSYTLRLPVDVRDALEQKSAITGKSCAQLVIEALVPAEPQHVYLMKRGSSHKIGISSDPARRRTSLGCDVELAWAAEVPDARGVELALHNHFKSKRLHGEWFDLDEQDVDWVKRLDLYHPVGTEGFVSRAVSCKCHPPKFVTDTARWRGFSWIPYECRKRSWNHRGEAEKVSAPVSKTGGADHAGSIPASPSSIHPVNMNPAMAKFMDQARIQVPIEELTQPINLCTHKEWSELDGEQYRCRLQSGHKGKCAPGERVS